MRKLSISFISYVCWILTTQNPSVKTRDFEIINKYSDLPDLYDRNLIINRHKTLENLNALMATLNKNKKTKEQSVYNVLEKNWDVIMELLYHTNQNDIRSICQNQSLIFYFLEGVKFCFPGITKLSINDFDINFDKKLFEIFKLIDLMLIHYNLNILNKNVEDFVKKKEQLDECIELCENFEIHIQNIFKKLFYISDLILTENDFKNKLKVAIKEQIQLANHDSMEEPSEFIILFTKDFKFGQAYKNI